MNEKIWIAEKDYDCEGSIFLGAWSSVEKAINACKQNYAKHEDTELTFDKLESNIYTARTRYKTIEYCVFETEIDSEDVDNE